MSLQRILTVSSLFIFFASPLVTRAEEVTCNHNTLVCECTATNPNDVCEFTFDIEILQTFTRYLLDNTGNSRGTAGSVWHINNGEWEPVDYDPSMGRNTLCDSSVDSTNCTQPFGVDGLASESVSVHWHGMHQRNSNWMDGVEHVTQCGIPPGASFTYYFYARPSGTHWYHSHSGAQRTDGLFGALIVKEKEQGNAQYTAFLNKLNDTNIQEDTYVDNPNEHTLTLLDWQKSSSLDLFTLIHSTIRYFDIDKASQLQGSGADRTYSSDGAEIGPVPYWSGLINGRGRHNSVNYINSSLSEFKVTAGQTYRFRLIGAQSLYAYRFSIEDHKLIVIATDGQFIEPIEVDYIIIHSGERYDFLLKTKSETDLVTTQQFMIRAVTLSFTATSTYATEQSAEAILNYNSATTPSSQYANIAARSQTVSQRCIDSDKCVALNCPFEKFPDNFNINCTHIHQLQLLTDYPGDLPDVATSNNSRLFFNFGFEGTRQTSTINGRNLKLPSASLAQLEASELTNIRNNEYCEDEKNENDEKKCDRDNTEEVISTDCYCTHVIEEEADQSIELVISATGPNPTQLENFLFAHPIHLHGHYFHVVDIQFGTTDPVTGRLTAGNSDIDCGGDTLCVRPRWKPNRDYSTRTGVTGRVSSKAPLKDTLLIPAGGYAVVYFKTDNPGWWFLHCHIEVHQLEGMGVIINEGGFKTPPPDGMNKCGNFQLTTNEFNEAIAVTTSPTPTPTSTEGGSSTGYIIGISITSVVAFLEFIIIIILIILLCLK
ncbi:PREDICTED: laccase-1-like [Amphimedon queenslandica]|uniref:Uncharacterized protein n=1 Tax=Amphimedon queenslandica TaxID=400682 RepID=A0AAN0JJD5_AMPQE|nr:PREDICTED: laccase-1-like [Amphimedon queenslandica]|eukprot:XP_019856867.1 PREDICTED: laccase-1-like [Amphimedon queenslandica]